MQRNYFPKGLNVMSCKLLVGRNVGNASDRSESKPVTSRSFKLSRIHQGSQVSPLKILSGSVQSVSHLLQFQLLERPRTRRWTSLRDPQKEEIPPGFSGLFFSFFFFPLFLFLLACCSIKRLWEKPSARRLCWEPQGGVLCRTNLSRCNPRCWSGSPDLG